MYRVSAPRKVADCVVSRSCTDDSACELEHTFRQEEKKKKNERDREEEGGRRRDWSMLSLAKRAANKM